MWNSTTVYMKLELRNLRRKLAEVETAVCVTFLLSLSNYAVMKITVLTLPGSELQIHRSSGAGSRHLTKSY